MPRRTKQRDLTTRVDFPKVRVSESGNNPAFLGTSPVVIKGKQFTVSEGHPVNRKTGKRDSGGPFFTYRIDASIPVSNVNIKATKSGLTYEYHGPMVTPLFGISPSSFGGFSPPSQDDSYLDKYGAEAIAITDPTNANADLGVALGELLTERKVPLPVISAWRDKTKAAKAAGSEYLAAQFGWLPLVESIKDTAQSVRDGNKIMQNYQAASGTLVHREFAFDDEESRSETILTTSGQAYIGNTPAAFNEPLTMGPIVKSTVRKTKRWFSGSFIYNNADRTSIQRCLGIGSEADKLFGLTLTPDVVWELTPWSWAIDWFSNTGNVISNATSFGLAGLVMKYGYIMEETTITDTYNMVGSGLKSVSHPPPPASVTCVTKRRREANPFGFGVGWEGLSPTQLAITAALGITRLR